MRLVYTRGDYNTVKHEKIRESSSTAVKTKFQAWENMEHQFKTNHMLDHVHMNCQWQAQIGNIVLKHQKNSKFTAQNLKHQYNTV